MNIYDMIKKIKDFILNESDISDNELPGPYLYREFSI